MIGSVKGQRRPLLSGHRALRRLLRRRTREVAFLKFDLAAMIENQEAQGLSCEVLDDPTDYCSEDIRTARTCLLQRLPI